MIKPWRQGDLDALCGVYAVINALRLIAPDRVDDRISDALFRALLRNFAAENGLFAAAVDGISDRSMGTNLTVACDLLNRRRPRIPVQWSQPIKGKRGLGLAALWSALRELLPPEEQGRRALVLGWDGEDPHWTTVRKVG